MTQKVLSTLELVGNATVTGLPAPSAASDATPKSYVDALINSLNWKDDCRAASAANINLASPGATIDGVSMALNDRFLAKDQSTANQNGIYVWNGAASPATRAADADAFDELEGARVRVTEGATNANTDWVQTQVNGAIGTNNIVLQSATGSAEHARRSRAGVPQRDPVGHDPLRRRARHRELGGVAVRHRADGGSVPRAGHVGAVIGEQS